jgi:hypothetical protein
MNGTLKVFCNFLRKGYTSVVSIAFLVFSGIALAQTQAAPVEVEVTMPEISWGSVAADLIGTLTTVAVVGLGVAISIWVLLLIARLFKRSAT